MLVMVGCSCSVALLLSSVIVRRLLRHARVRAFVDGCCTQLRRVLLLVCSVDVLHAAACLASDAQSCSTSHAHLYIDRRTLSKLNSAWGTCTEAVRNCAHVWIVMTYMAVYSTRVTILYS